MSLRFTGLIRAIALSAPLVAGVAHAQTATTGGGGGNAYPDSLASGQNHVQAPTARDTGGMQLPAGSGGVASTASRERDVGGMQLPAGSGGIVTNPVGRTRLAVAQRADVAPAPGRSPAAAAMADDPGTPPVPYTDFLAPPAQAGHARHAAVHHALAHHAAASATPAADTSGPATPK